MVLGGMVVGGAVVDGGGELGWGRESRWRTVVVVRHCPGHVGAAVVPVDRLLCRPMPRRGMAAGWPNAQLRAAIWRSASATPSVLQGGAVGTSVVTVTGWVRKLAAVVARGVSA